MKKITILLASAGLLLGLPSCDEWLTATSSTQISDTQLFSSRNGFQEALSGIYLCMAQPECYGRDYTWFVSDLTAFPYAAQHHNTYISLQNHNYTNAVSFPFFTSMWQSGYHAIANINKMLQELPHLDKSTKLTLANAIFFNNKMEINVPYKKQVEKFYDAEVKSLDFNQKAAALRAINGWCNKQTNGLIPAVLEDVEPDMFTYLLNALYFKGTWMYPFNKRYTRERTFTLESGQQKEIPMMEKERKFAYNEDDICQRVSLPYGNGAYSMIVLLPKKGHTVSDVIASIDGVRWNDFRSQMYHSTLINVWLPPFESKYHIKLNDILIDMGMPRSFGPAADFRPMSKDALWLSFVQQDAVIKVDEEGTEAAAITSAGMLGATAVAQPPRVIDFHCDHPFLYLITENSTGTILFAGKFTGK